MLLHIPLQTVYRSFSITGRRYTIIAPLGLLHGTCKHATERRLSLVLGSWESVAVAVGVNDGSASSMRHCMLDIHFYFAYFKLRAIPKATRAGP